MYCCFQNLSIQFINKNYVLEQYDIYTTKSRYFSQKFLFLDKIQLSLLMPLFFPPWYLNWKKSCKTPLKRNKELKVKKMTSPLCCIIADVSYCRTSVKQTLKTESVKFEYLSAIFIFKKCDVRYVWGDIQDMAGLKIIFHKTCRICRKKEKRKLIVLLYNCNFRKKVFLKKLYDLKFDFKF